MTQRSIKDFSQKALCSLLCSSETSWRLKVNGSTPSVKTKNDVKCQKSNVKSQMSNVKCQKSNVKSQMSNVKCQMSNVKCQMSNVKSQKSKVKCQMSNVKCQMSNVKSSFHFRLLQLEAVEIPVNGLSRQVALRLFIFQSLVELLSFLATG